MSAAASLSDTNTKRRLDSNVAGGQLAFTCSVHVGETSSVSEARANGVQI